VGEAQAQQLREGVAMMDEYDNPAEFPREEARRCEDCSHYECCSADGFIGGCRPEFNETEEEE
jgi:hypothetical protein